MVFRLSGDAKTLPAGTAGNLIIEVFDTRKAKDGKAAARWPIGHLPAIPFRIE